MSTISEIREALTAPGEMFEIETVAVNGVETRTWKHASSSLREILDLSALQGAKDFMVFEDERISFEDHYRRAATFAQRLVEHGVGKGDRVAIAMRNFPEWVVSFWGSAIAGAIVVPLNAWWLTNELVYGLKDSGARILIADEDRAIAVRERLGETSLEQVVVAHAEGTLEPHEVGFNEFLGDVAADATPPDVQIGPDDPATIFYTSGTTGEPKGALGTHRNICSAVMNTTYGALAGIMRKAAEPGAETSDDAAGDLATVAAEQSTLISVPFFHVTGCHGFMLSSLSFGIKMVMMYKWDPERALELVERERISTVGGVPAMVQQMLDHPRFDEIDTSTVQNISYGGAPAPPELVRRIGERFPKGSPTNGWGMTETSGGFSSNTGQDYFDRPDSCGLPTPTGEVKIVDPEGNRMPTGEVGELCVKGPGVIREYWQKPEANAETFDQGWLRTGDIARVDDEGFITIVDRAKDVVIRGGENVYCAEVEAAIFEHEAVGDCAVIGVPHEVLGEEVGAVVVPKAGTSLDADEIRAFVKERLASFKVPTHVWVRSDEMPRNAAGKILKRDLRDEVLA